MDFHGVSNGTRAGEETVQTVLSAIVYLPPYADLDSRLVRSIAEQLLHCGLAQVTVLAAPSGWAARWQPTIHGTAAGSQGRYSGRVAPIDESPTVAILDRWRAAAGNAPSAMRRPKRIYSAADLVEETARRWGHGTRDVSRRG